METTRRDKEISSTRTQEGGARNFTVIELFSAAVERRAGIGSELKMG